jgi:hypothetical protein
VAAMKNGGKMRSFYRAQSHSSSRGKRAVKGCVAPRPPRRRELHHDDFTVYEGPLATGKLISGGINFRGDRGDARIISGPAHENRWSWRREAYPWVHTLNKPNVQSHVCIHKTTILPNLSDGKQNGFHGIGSGYHLLSHSNPNMDTDIFGMSTERMS